MRRLLPLLLPVCLSITGTVVAEDPPIDDTRLSIHTLVREDMFAGFRAGNMTRFERGEKNIEKLLESRPDARADLLAWKGGAELFYAVRAHEDGKKEEFNRRFAKAKEIFAEARKLSPKGPGVAAVIGGSYVMFTDRLPKEYHEAAWTACYDNYFVLWQQQEPALERMPLHIKGELLAGLVQSSQRLGRTEEYKKYLDRMIDVLPDTQYSRIALRWKKDPQSAVGKSIACKYCHSPGKLSEQVASLKK